MIKASGGKKEMRMFSTNYEASQTQTAETSRYCLRSEAALLYCDGWKKAWRRRTPSLLPSAAVTHTLRDVWAAANTFRKFHRGRAAAPFQLADSCRRPADGFSCLFSLPVATPTHHHGHSCLRLRVYVCCSTGETPCSFCTMLPSFLHRFISTSPRFPSQMHRRAKKQREQRGNEKNP